MMKACAGAKEWQQMLILQNQIIHQPLLATCSRWEEFFGNIMINWSSLFFWQYFDQASVSETNCCIPAMLFENCLYNNAKLSFRNCSWMGFCVLVSGRSQSMGGPEAEFNGCLDVN